MSIRYQRRQRIRSDERGDLEQSTASDSFRALREAAPLHVGELDPPSAELLLEDAVLFAEILDYVLLTTIHPAGKHPQQELKLQLMHGIEGSPSRESAVGRSPRFGMTPSY